jgi:hypothetical protein
VLPPSPVVRELRKRFGSQLRFVFRNFPLGEIHPHAEMAAEIAEFADANGKFWQMHDLLFENQSRLAFRFLPRSLNNSIYPASLCVKPCAPNDENSLAMEIHRVLASAGYGSQGR